jgi:NAD-dependent DNA ligase
MHDERKEVEELVTMLGGKFTDRLTSKVDLLICKGQSSEKYHKAKEWGILIHDLDWLRRKFRDANPGS